MSKIRHEWYQTDTEVVLSVFIKNVTSESLTATLLPTSISLSIKLPTGTDVIFDLDPLAHEINVAESTTRIAATKLEFKLRKKEAIRWTKIEGEDSAAAPNPSPVVTSTYPTSSKTKTNWDALAKQAIADEEAASSSAYADPNAGGDKELNSMFQKLYAGATDEQRKAMIKSYQESNGTSLSTDWSEVSKGRVKTQPPDSMVEKKW